MTHDELLAELSIPIILRAGIQETDIVNVDLLVKRGQALRAVVELCTENTDHHLIDKDWVLKAIEKELG